MPDKNVEQALLLLEKAVSLLREAKTEVSEIVQEVASEPAKAASSIFDVMSNNKWPLAVNPNLICDKDNEQDKKDRATGIVELMIEENLNGKKFLDFGCGEGHVPVAASQHKASLSVGYDLSSNDAWKSGPNLQYMTSLDEVKDAGPFDVVLIFDVLDHVSPYNDLSAPANVLTEVASLLSENGKIYLRCHPWTSRHATHVYHTHNKAYIHMLYTEEEMDNMNMEQEKVQKVITPIKTYREWIEAAGLKIDNERVIKEPVESFFKETQEVRERITQNTRLGNNQFPEFQMSIQFVDYILSKPKE